MRYFIQAWITSMSCLSLSPPSQSPPSSLPPRASQTRPGRLNDRSTVQFIYCYAACILHKLTARTAAPRHTEGGDSRYLTFAYPPTPVCPGTQLHSALCTPLPPSQRVYGQRCHQTPRQRLPAPSAKIILAPFRPLPFNSATPSHEPHISPKFQPTPPQHNLGRTSTTTTTTLR